MIWVSQSTKCGFSQEHYVEDTLSPFKSNIGNVYCPLDVLGFLTIVFIRSVGSTSGGRGGGGHSVMLPNGVKECELR